MQEQHEHRSIPIITPFLAAVQFLTLVPPLIRRPFSAKELGRAVAFFPVTGLLMGFVLMFSASVIKLVFPYSVTVGIVLALWVLMSGAIHLDGFLDACDGLFGGSNREQRLEIMRDERLGAYAFAGGLLLLLLKYISLGSAGNWNVLLAAPVVGRWGIAWVLVLFPYARSSGLGKWMKDNTGWPQLTVAGLTTAVVLYWLSGWVGLLILVLVTVMITLAALWVKGRIGGMTGDIYGAVCELSELLFLLAATQSLVNIWAR